MCISGTVGPGARNDIADVTVVQILLNENSHRFPATGPELATDGRIGRNTLAAIEAFETGVMGLPSSDGLIAPGDSTIRALLEGLAPGPTKEKLAIVLPNATRSKIELYFEPLKAGMLKYGIASTPLQMAHFIAQIGHESGSFLYSEEIASGAAYEGRHDLGNTEPGDGKRFKGRGLIQLTGRANYASYGNYNHVDYLHDPSPLATDPLLSVDAACWYWAVLRKIGPHAEADDVKTVSKRINGGPPINGLDERIANLNRAKAVLGLA